MITKSPTVFAGWILMVSVLMTGHNIANAQCDGNANCRNSNCTSCAAGQTNTGFQSGRRAKKCGCRQGRRCQQCPKCQQDFCQLEVKVGKEKRTCFTTEQKLICIPTIRLPWQKCQPTCSKTRVVNVLKKHKFECPKCEYKWSVNEPEVSQPATQDSPADLANQYAPNQNQYQDPSPMPREPLNQDSLQQAEPFRPRYKQEVFDPTGSDVPLPPKK